MAISPSLRFAVLERDGFHCFYCGGGSVLRLQIDHVRPQCAGGTDDYLNLVTACDDCNVGKGATLLSSEALEVVRGHIHSAGLRRNVELISAMPEVRRLVPDDHLEIFADILEDPFWPRDGEWLRVLKCHVDEFQRKADGLPPLVPEEP